MIPSPEIKELTLKDYFDIANKHRWLIIAIFVAVTGITIFYDLSSPKIYMTKTILAAETEKPQITGKVEGIYKNERTASREYAETQLNILNSRSLAERVIKNLGLDRDPEFMNSKDPTGKLLSMVSVDASKSAPIASIYVKGRDPLKITTIANAWVREFIHQDVERKVGTAKYGIAFLEDQLTDTLKKLNEAENALSDFIKKNRIVTIPDIETKTEELLGSLKAQKSQLEKEIAEASQKYKDKHPKMISLVTQLKSVEEKIGEETNSRLALQEKMAEYGILKRRVATYNYLYEDFLKRAKELDVSKELVFSGIRIIDPAEVPKAPISPQPKRDILFAILAGLILGVSASLGWEYLDSTLKTSEDVEFYIKFPFLGYIPSIKNELKNNKNGNIFSYGDPRSRVAEAFRNLKVSLLFSFPQDKVLKTIVVTSSIPSEGKTFVSSNLATIFAQAKEPTLLIDADMRKGDLYKSFNLKPKNGLSTLLAGMASIEEAVVQTAIPNLSLLPAGPYTPNPTELLSSDKLPNILRELEKRYKRIIIDSTPILNVSEALILGDKTDGIVFVVRAGHTSMKYIMEAKKIINKRVKIIGAVLNDTQMDSDKYYYHYYYPSPAEKK